MSSDDQETTEDRCSELDSLHAQCTCPRDGSEVQYEDCPKHGAAVRAQLVRDARVALIENLQSLRYAGSVPLLMAVAELVLNQSETEFLDWISEWLIGFGKVLDTVGETHTEMARELVDLRTQRKAIRDFFGFAQLGGTAAGDPNQ